MRSGLRYRFTAVFGTALLASAAVIAANEPLTQQILTTRIPLVNRLNPVVLFGSDLSITLGLTTLALLVSLFPLFKPRPRRVDDTLMQSSKRVILASFALAALGYYDYSYRLPRSTLIFVTVFLLITIPLFFAVATRRPTENNQRLVVIGDDYEEIEWILEELDSQIVGVIAPSRHSASVITDGGLPEQHLGGLSRLDDVLVEHQIDTAILAFTETDRAEFFGALEKCYEHGVVAKVHRQHADSVLTGISSSGEFITINLEPWDPQEYLAKRVFDVAFSAAALMILSPVFVLIAIAILIEGEGPIFYSQERTATFGETFHIHKFRTMIPESESASPGEDATRITPLGSFLRRTHLDEAPQLWTILVGKMSVVGPRAAWTEEEQLIEKDLANWRKRWFVKPGLTGLAQVEKASSLSPETKLRYDVQYIRERSLWLDVQIVLRQLWFVFDDVYKSLRQAWT